MKKLISNLLVMVMILSSVQFAEAADEDYITRGEVAEMLMTAADDYNPHVKKTDIIRGYGDGELHEEEKVTRAEALIMLNRAFGGLPEATGHNLRISIPKENFTDIPEWAEAELEPVFDAGIAAGTAPGIFSPDENVTREQMELFITRVYALYGSNLKDSYFASVNKNILDTFQIPEGETMAGTMYDVMDKTDEQILEIIEEAVNSQPEEGSHQEKIKIFYDNITDMEARNKAGYSPIADDIEAIDALSSVSDINELSILDGTANAFELLGSFTLTIDSEDSNHYIPVFEPVSATMAKEVYTGEANGIMPSYIKYITTLLMLCGEDEEEARNDAIEFFVIETQLSEASLTTAEMYDVEKTYNIYSLEEIQNIFPEINMTKLFEDTGIKDSSRIQVVDVGNMEKVAEIIDDGNMEALKSYMKTALIMTCADYFGEDFRQAEITFNQEVMGIEGYQSVEQEAIGIVSNALSDYVGEMYAEKYCSDEMIADVTAMVEDIMDVYRSRIENLTWMSEETKEKALLKLDTMRVNIGAPDYDNVKEYLDNADLKSGDEGGSYFQNILEISEAVKEENARLSGGPVDKTQWITTPQTVNAFYHPSFNSINFPAAFMQDPIYDINASYEEKLGGVGFVISHEMTHAFDSSGSQYDEQGNAVNWWTEEDAAAFDALCDEVVEFFDGQECAPGIAVDGELTLTENIADLGAISCVTELGMKTEGFDFKKMFESYGRLWALTATRAALESQVYTDTHSPANVRVDRVLQSCDMFYEVYDIGENDGMYVPTEERAGIW